MYANLEEGKKKRVKEVCHKAQDGNVLGSNLEKSSKCLVLLLHIIESYWNERIISPGTCCQVEASTCILIHLLFVCMALHVMSYPLKKEQMQTILCQMEG